MLSHERSLSASFLDTRFIRFLFAGGLAALLNFGSRFFYNTFVDFSAAVVLAFLTGLTAGYVLNKLFVFKFSGNSIRQEISWFIVINLFALLQTWGLSVYLAQFLLANSPLTGRGGSALAEAIAHGAGVLLPVFTSYIGHKYLTFRE